MISFSLYMISHFTGNKDNNFVKVMIMVRKFPVCLVFNMKQTKILFQISFFFEIILRVIHGKPPGVFVVYYYKEKRKWRQPISAFFAMRIAFYSIYIVKNNLYTKTIEWLKHCRAVITADNLSIKNRAGGYSYEQLYYNDKISGTWK